MSFRSACARRRVLLSLALASAGGMGSAAAQPAVWPAASASVPADASQTAQRPILALLFEAAWQRHPASASQTARLNAARAQQDAAAQLMPQPPALTVAHRTDQGQRNEGRREYEADLAAPLWLPGQRAAARQNATVQAQMAQTQQAVEQLKLAQELRQRWWQLVLATNALTLERARVAEAQQLADDLQRRLKAGDVARTDANQAQIQLLTARGAQMEAEQALEAQLTELQTLTGLDASRLRAWAAQRVEHEQVQADRADAPHPELLSMKLAFAAAQSRLQQAAVSDRAAPSVSLGVIRERDAFGEPARNTLRLGVTVPFSSAPASLAATEGARAEVLEAETLARRTEERLRSQARLARAAVQRARDALQAAEQRVSLSGDTAALLARAHRLGEVDLATRLRAQTEQIEAQRALVHAQAQLGRSLSELNQSLGRLP